MNSISFSVGYLMAILMVCVYSKDYHLMSDKDKVTKNGPYNFRFPKLNDFLLMEITLKNIPPSVNHVYIIYSLTNYLATIDTYPEKEKADAEIKNGEVKIMIQRSLNNFRIVIDVELQTRVGLCNKARVAEGRFADTNHRYWNDTIGKQVYWYTDWEYDVSDTAGACLVPKLCEIVVDFQSHCEDNLKCYLDGKKYICTFYNGKMKPYKLYQTYDTDRQITKPFFREDYTYIHAEDSFYKIHTIPKNWNNALTACAEEGASLFYPENIDEAEAVISFWKQNQKSIRYMYVGISDVENEGVFVTIDGKPISKVYSKWVLNQPDNYQNEDCVHMYLKGEYNDIPCNKKYNFICKKSLPHNLSSVIGTPLDIATGYTRFIIELESFDNNTSMHVKKPGHGVWSEKIILPSRDAVKDIVKLQSYSLTTEVQFSCEEYKPRSKYVYLALINTTENEIETFDKTLMINRKFKMANNGSILCCLYYVYDSMNNGKEVNITRYVVKKTLLTYQLKELISPKTVGRLKNRGRCLSKTSQDTTKSRTCPGKTYPNECKSDQRELDSSSHWIDAGTGNNYVTLTIIISTVIASILALLVVMYVFMKRRQRESNRRERSQRPLPQIPRQPSLSEPNPNLPFYQNLLFRRECDLEIQAREEAHYEEITNQ